MDYGSLLILFAILFVLMIFPNLADQARQEGKSGSGWAALGYILALALYSCILIGGVMVWFSGRMMQQNPDLLKDIPLQLGNIDLLKDIASFDILGLGMAVPALIAMLLLLPPVRQLLSKLIPIDPASSVHAMALSFSMLVVMQLSLALGIGLGTMSDLLAQQPQQEAREVISVLWVQQLLTALLGFVGVGLLIRRSFSESVERLGLVVPSFGQVMLGIGMAFVLVFFLLVASWLGEQVGLRFDQDVDKLTEQMLGSLFKSIGGILTVGLAAAIGEETLMRGAVQPRFGIVLTALIFSLLHANYGITFSTGVVFVIGLVLGVIRNRHNTSTAMITHAVYNCTLASLAYLGVQFLDQ